MKPISLTAMAFSALALCAASAPSFAQSQSTDSAQPTPAPILIETKVGLTTGGPQTPESSYDAHKEATAALAEAKTACRHEPRQSQAECLRQARDDYNATLARARH